MAGNGRHEATDAITEPMYKFWGYKRDAWSRDAGLRSDHVLLNTVAAARLGTAGVDREAPANLGRAITRQLG